MPNPEEDEDEGPEVSYNLAIYTAEEENDTAILCDGKSWRFHSI